MGLYFQSVFRTCARCGAETAFREANEKYLGESSGTRKLSSDDICSSGSGIFRRTGGVKRAFLYR